ncbi:hypothetical protein EYZ11_007309 [Aspergillus tanneri]|uniref:Endopolyphosphatase n=1 Tax=Aspergillus tanneri TaxID=1220188 RepID=A0A4V3UP06_9EURO|nr:hypothetical protein EYZ11_007309 [Aspergillus tanneri]
MKDPTDDEYNWTKEFRSVWAEFIPKSQYSTFDAGGWFTTEVIPNKLAVISLNMMYFYLKNNCVHGCDKESQPGFRHMKWLHKQLSSLRLRNMKAILIGHVPPARSGRPQEGKPPKEWNTRYWRETCWRKYTHLVHQFGDVVVGIVYGHMNIDHFILQDSDEAEILDDSSSLQFPTMSFDNSDESDHWFLNVVPNFFPTLRVVNYNISGLTDVATWASYLDEDAAFGLPSPDIIINDDQSIEKKGKEEKTKQLLFKVPEHQSSCPPPGPAYLNQPLTWLGCIQYFANITKINNRMSKTHGLKDNSGNFTDAEVNEASKTSHDYNDDDLIFEVEYDTSEDDIYRMDDLTVRSFLDLAIQIGKGYKDPSVSKMNIGGLATSNIGAIRSDEFDIKKRKEKKSRNKDTAWRTFFRRATVGF